MEILEHKGNPELAEIYVARMRSSPLSLVEFVDAIDPRYSRKQKWVVTVSTQFGCPVQCLFCDSGGFFDGNLTADEILAEIDHVVRRRAPDGRIDCAKFKIHFARMGEPSLNDAMLDVLERLPGIYDAPGLIPCIPTVAPRSAGAFFEKLLAIKRGLYDGGHFQLQFSVNTTDVELRDRLMPVKKWGFGEIRDYAERWYGPGDRKVVLNFALSPDNPVDPDVIVSSFDPRTSMVKVTPINPTDMAVSNGFRTMLSAEDPHGADALVDELGERGFDCVISIGEAEEIEIGSNCGQAASRIVRGRLHAESRAEPRRVV
jgi:23S rRNA (adenine2503-C2)-methyltransferase